MRIHVDSPKLTTVSVDDDLMALLGAVLVLTSPAKQADKEAQLKLSRTFVKGLAAQFGPQSSIGVSRAVQRAIFRRIVDPKALEILDAVGSDEAISKAAAAHLEECARNGWLTPSQIEERRRRK